MVQGTWPADDLRRAFVAGARWWEFQSTQGTMWASDSDKAEAEADKRYPDGAPRPDKVPLYMPRIKLKCERILSARPRFRGGALLCIQLEVLELDMGEILNELVGSFGEQEVVEWITEKPVALAESVKLKFPLPWSFTWDGAPRIWDAEGKVVAVLSTGTLDGAHDSADVVALANSIIGMASQLFPSLPPARERCQQCGGVVTLPILCGDCAAGLTKVTYKNCVFDADGICTSPDHGPHRRAGD